MNEQRIADRIAGERVAGLVPGYLTNGVPGTGGFSVDENKDGSYTLNYGDSMGSATFKTWDKLKAEAEKWLAKNIKMTQRREKGYQRALKTISTFKVARDMTGVKGLFGEEYPDDSKYAELMAQYFPAPKRALEKRDWELYRNWLVKNRATNKEAIMLMNAVESGGANAVIGGRPSNMRDVDEIARRLGII